MKGVSHMEPATRRYLVRFSVGMVSYCVLLVAALLIGRAMAPPWRILGALAVLPAVVLIMRAIMLHWRETDELARSLMVESLAIGFAVGTPIILVIGLFQAFGLADLSFLWAYGILMGGWLLGAFLARRRYF